MDKSHIRVHERLWDGQGTAVTDRSGFLTYAELRARVADLADELRAAGVGPGSAVMVAHPCSADAIVTIFAVWASGAVVICVDPTWPVERIAKIVHRTRASAVLTDEVLAVRLVSCGFAGRPIGEQYVLQDRLRVLAGGKAPFSSSPTAAYVIFTSGTTAEPKGVVISHQSLGNYLDWRTRSLAMDPGFRVAATAPMGVDVMLRELVWPVTAGGCVVPFTEEERGDTAHLIDALRRNRITIAHTLPSVLEMLLDEPDFSHLPDLRIMHASAERLQWSTVHRFKQASNAALHHSYGPTEATVSVTFFDCMNAVESGSKFVPLGRPSDNVTIQVMHEGLPAGPGVVGELHIAGASVGLGYFDDDPATAQAFSQDPVGERWYRSGDLGALNHDGTFQFHGRVDDQLKVRGYRIEPGEIEGTLLAQSGVRDAVVLADRDGLVAVVQPEPGSPVGARELRESAAQVLPEYMLPRIELVAAIPRTAAGKIDKQAVSESLRRPGASIGQPPTEDRDQRVRELVLQAWREVIPYDGIGDGDDFFEIGGVSIHAMRIATRLRKVFGRLVDVSLIFDHPTVRELAAEIIERASASVSPANASHPAGEPAADEPVTTPAGSPLRA